MAEQVSVYAVDALTTAISDLNSLQSDVNSSCDEEISKAEQLLEEVQQEEASSKQLLEAAKAAEAAAHTALIAAEAALAAASASLAAAIAEANPPAIAAAAEAVAEAERAVQTAKEIYEAAVKHRELMEKRYELAVKCLRMTEEMAETLKMKLNGILAQLKGICSQGTGRLTVAHSDLMKYMGNISPSAVSTFTEWKTYKPAPNKPVMPDVLHERLNVSDDHVKATLSYLMATDEKFRNVVVRLRTQLSEGADPAQVERQIRKTVTGRVCEELVKNAFEPFGGSVSMQEVKTVEDGSYTKIDMVIENLKVPVVLGRGEGMAAPAGGAIAIEVKSGKKEYLVQQTSHLQFQAQGHQDYDASCTVCTRDIKELSPEAEKKLRDKLHEAGSPILGMLPKKEELDSSCVDYVMNG